MLTHKARKKNEERVRLVHEGLRMFRAEGLNNVKYKLQDIVKYPLFTHILINVGINQNSNKTSD